MEHLTPFKIAEATGGRYIGDPAYCFDRVAGAVRDNRDVKSGNLFVCIRGARVDGHDYANAAFQAGAACCLAEREIPNAEGPYILVSSTLTALRMLGGYYRRFFNIPIIGITGSVGKTTAKEMIASALGARLRVLKTPANLNNEIGVPLTLLSLDETYDVAVIEMGISEFGEMSRLSEMVRPDICVMTKIGYSHLETLGDLNGVLRAKSEVYRYMKPDGFAIVNGDDELLRTFDPGFSKITFGLDPKNDFYADNIGAKGTDTVTCDIVGGGWRFSAVIPAFGSHLILAALPAAAVGRKLGLSDDEIARGLLAYAPVGGRANVVDTGYITLIDDCYNANPNSVRASLASLSSLTGRRVAILGDMKELGEHSDELHREVGSFARELGVDCLLCCGESALHILHGAAKDGGMPSLYFPNKAVLLRTLPELIERGDNVLVKASHSMGFEEIAEFLKELGK